ncbi:50S ribosomal protein L19 [Candidatus Woesebacteria bacterium]|nr:50S ribosomal protein L19 [Candidatus Woesebacteria bacterium]
MANHVQYKDTSISIGDTIAVDYKIKEADDKIRIQQFAGILLKIKGNSDSTRMITVRKISKSGVGVERIFPLSSPFIDDIKVTKKSLYPKARAYFIRDLSQKNTRLKLYKAKVEMATEAPEESVEEPEAAAV